MEDKVINIKASALRELCLTMPRYAWPRDGQIIADRLLAMLKHYGNEELVSITNESYNIMLLQR